jgi:tripartite-type tricarboxylate transporter receptor subunit TctC
MRAACCALALMAWHAHAQQWPARPVRVVVPFPAGGPADVLGRIAAAKFTQATGQQFVIDNRGGANGNIGAAIVAKAAPDGYTILFATTGPLALNAMLYKNTPFDPVKDFAPIVHFGDVPMIIVVNPSLPVKSLADLIAQAKASPNKFTYASPGRASLGHLVAELVQRNTGVQMNHIPYKGSAPAVIDVLAGAVPVAFDLAATYFQHARAGKVRALAVSTAQRFTQLPDVPTVAESVPGFQATGWFGAAGPAGMPAAAITTMNRAANEYLASAEGIARLSDLAVRPVGGRPEEFGAFVRAEIAKWRPVVEPLATSLD